jgi:hypothetical protein
LQRLGNRALLLAQTFQDRVEILNSLAIEAVSFASRISMGTTVGGPTSLRALTYCWRQARAASSESIGIPRFTSRLIRVGETSSFRASSRIPIVYTLVNTTLWTVCTPEKKRSRAENTSSPAPVFSVKIKIDSFLQISNDQRLTYTSQHSSLTLLPREIKSAQGLNLLGLIASGSPRAGTNAKPQDTYPPLKN